MTVDDTTEKILLEIHAQLKAALDDAARDRELAHREIARADQFEARFDMLSTDLQNRMNAIAADIREIRSDIAAIMLLKRRNEL